MIKLKEKIEGTTTIKSFVLLSAMFVCLVVAENMLNLQGIAFDYFRLLSNSILLFLFFKFYLVFCSETDYSKKKMDIIERYQQIRASKYVVEGRQVFLSVSDSIAILNAECKRENNMHIKAVIREVVILLALGMLLSQRFTFGG
jgi:hypothetical protein